MLLKALNLAIENGTPSSELAMAGVLLHQFDGTTDKNAPWMPCPEDQWCHGVGDRLSSSIVSKHLPFLFNVGGAGIVLSPAATKIRCSYFSDGGTMSKQCPATKSGLVDCVPGCCDTYGEPNWCDDVGIESQAVYQCAFRPRDLGAMLRHHELRAGQLHNYNEVIVDATAWDPTKSFLAFYFVDGDKHKAEARDAHSKYHELHTAVANSPNPVPLLHLNLNPNPGQPYFTRVA